MQKEHEPWSCYIVSNLFYGNISTFGFNCITSQEILLLRAYAEKPNSNMWSISEFKQACWLITISF